MEAARRELQPVMEGACFVAVITNRPNLRVPFPPDFAARLEGHTKEAGRSILLDVLYPQDLRQRSVFTDTEDLRLPAWSQQPLRTLEKLNLPGPNPAVPASPKIKFIVLWKLLRECINCSIVKIVIALKKTLFLCCKVETSTLTH